MKKKTARKLVLRTESLRSLGKSALSTVAAGEVNHNGTLYCTKLIGCETSLCETLEL
jgi:hypothetical protein